MFQTTVQDANGMGTTSLYFMNSFFLRSCQRKSKGKSGRNFIIAKLSSLKWIVDTKATGDINWEF
jgi:hypothetical protein